MHSLILTFRDGLVLFPWQTYLFLRERFKILPHAGLHLRAGWGLRRLQNKGSWAPAGTGCSQLCRPGWASGQSAGPSARWETVAHAQPRASRLVWAALGPLSIYTNSLTVSGTADVSEGGTVHRVFHMKIFKQKELKKIPV